MPKPTSSKLTQLIHQFEDGDDTALSHLLPLVYDHLRRIAGNHLKKQGAGHTLQPTALVHEVFLKLLEKKSLGVKDRAHFFAVSSRIMRHILIDYARGKNRKKRGGGAFKVSFDEALHWTPEEGTDMLALDQALTELATKDERRARVVELRYFGGLTVEETAEIMQSSPATVKRDFSLARAWLHRELTAKKN